MESLGNASEALEISLEGLSELWKASGRPLGAVESLGNASEALEILLEGLSELWKALEMLLKLWKSRWKASRS